MAVFCDYLSVATLVPLILNMFIDMATSSPVIFIDHVATLKQLAEQQPVYIHQVVQIIGAIGTVSEVRFCTDFLNVCNNKSHSLISFTIESVL